MRVLYFTRDYTPHDHRFLSALVETTHDIHFLRLERRGGQREERALPARVRQTPWAGGAAPVRWQDGLRLAVELRGVLNAVKPDVVHAGSIQTAALLTALAGFRPLVSMSWGSDLLKDADRNWTWKWATRFTLRRSSVLVGDCEAVKSKAEEMGFPPRRVVLFPWGVDLEHFSPGDGQDLRRRLGWENQFVMLSLRSWEAIYGVDVLVKAFASAVRQNRDLRLLLLGNGSLAPSIHRLVNELGLESMVHFGGQVAFNGLPGYYRAADLYLSASHSDGSSVSLMEALACGRPVLISDIPGNREWITSGDEGWLFQDGDAGALAEGMLKAAEQRGDLPNMGDRARRLAERRADWKKNFPCLLNAYEMALDGRN